MNWKQMRVTGGQEGQQFEVAVSCSSSKQEFISRDLSLAKAVRLALVQILPAGSNLPEVEEHTFKDQRASVSFVGGGQAIGNDRSEPVAILIALCIRYNGLRQNGEPELRLEKILG
ncbi:MAG: hypothetical protein WC768_00615 [Patescibacteria group bacterium]